MPKFSFGATGPHRVGSYELFQGRVYCAVWKDCLVSREKSHRQHVKEQLALYLFELLSKKKCATHITSLDLRNGLRLASTTLGKPLLLSDEHPRACVSFSYAERDIWGAITDIPWLCGVDAALEQDFDLSFPVAKVFSQAELEAGSLVEKNRISLIALLWSAKESVVKAAGCGFHSIPPRDIRLSFVSSMPGMLSLEGNLSMRPNDRGVGYLPGIFHIVSFVHGRAWISVAMGDTPPASTRSKP